MLSLFDSVHFNDDITRVQEQIYTPSTQNFNNCDLIEIAIQNSDAYLNISDSMLMFEGTVTGPAAGDQITAPNFKFVNNGYMHLFQEITYSLNGIDVDSIRSPGIATTMKAGVSFSEEESKSMDLIGWKPKSANIHTNFTYKHVDGVGKGNFVVCIPLKFIFGFAEDYKKVLINCKHKLTLLRSNTDINAYQSEIENLKVQIKKVEWRVPHVMVNDENRYKLLKVLEGDKKISLPFRKWMYFELPALRRTTSDVWSLRTTTNLEKPRYIILGIQKSDKRTMNGDCSTFDHVNMRNIKVYLNDVAYPYNNLNLNYGANSYANAYLMYLQFQQSYYGKKYNEPIINYTDFKENPLYVFDCSKQSDMVAATTVDTKIEFETTEVFPAETKVCCLILCDNLFEYTVGSGIVRKIV